MKKFTVGYGSVKKVTIGDQNKITFIGGPCAIESREHALSMAYKINKICKKLNVQWIYKSCYDKDCRSSIKSFHGIGINEGLDILAEVRDKFKIPVLSDFSESHLAKQTASVCDIIQIPAYLCRQTSILRAAAITNRPILLKKGQFMSPWNLRNSLNKLKSFGNSKILLTDRGTFFGYNMLVNDFRAFKIMKEMNQPVCYDATHSIQMPTSMGEISGGQREFIPYLARAAVAFGIDALFMEIHDNPDKAKSDPGTVLNIKFLEPILKEIKEFHKLQKKFEKNKKLYEKIK